jgi:sugar phosphate isomerase/epimerase
MHERVSVNALCFGGPPLAEMEAIWQKLVPKRISFMTSQVFAESEEAAAAIVARNGYGVETLSHAFQMTPLSADEADWAEPRANASRAIAFAKSVGARSIYMVTGGRGDRTWEEAAEIFAAAVAPCAAEAKQAAVALLIETAPPVYGRVHIAHNLRDTVTLAEMAGIGVCIDIFSCWSEAGLRQTIERAAPITQLVQASDYVLGDNCLPARAVPGDGNLPLRQICGWILDAGYRNGFDLELIGPRIDDEGRIAATARAAAHMGELIASLGG